MTTSSNKLQGVRVFVTRPAHQAAAFCQLIEQAGGTALRFPTVTIEPSSNFATTAESLANPEQFDLIIFTSPNAVSFAKPALCYSPVPKWLAIGPKTAAALSQITNIEPLHAKDSFNSEAALQLDVLKAVAGKNILIVKGEGGRSLLANTLTKRGATVQSAEVYRRIKPTDWQAESALEMLQNSHVVTVTSVGILQNLYTMLATLDEKKLLSLPVVTGGKRIAEEVIKLGFQQPPVIADSPCDEAMLSALLNWAAVQHTE